MLRDPSLIPLSHQHQHALALCVQTRRTLAANPTAVEIRSLADTILGHFESEMRNHFASEETILFPMMAAFPSTETLVVELASEHRRMTELVHGLDASPAKDSMLEFSELLVRHVRKEEGVLFEEAQRLLTREQLKEAGELLVRSL